jgi:hypothetical protein
MTAARRFEAAASSNTDAKLFASRGDRDAALPATKVKTAATASHDCS